MLPFFTSTKAKKIRFIAHDMNKKPPTLDEVMSVINAFIPELKETGHYLRINTKHVFSEPPMEPKFGEDPMGYDGVVWETSIVKSSVWCEENQPEDKVVVSGEYDEKLSEALVSLLYAIGNQED
jgi:hypothetical protein